MRKAFIQGAGLALFIFVVLTILAAAGLWVWDIYEVLKT